MAAINRKGQKAKTGGRSKVPLSKLRSQELYGTASLVCPKNSTKPLQRFKWTTDLTSVLMSIHTNQRIPRFEWRNVSSKAHQICIKQNRNTTFVSGNLWPLCFSFYQDARLFLFRQSESAVTLSKFFLHVKMPKFGSWSPKGHFFL